MTDHRHNRTEFETRPPFSHRLLQAIVGGIGGFVAIIVTVTLIGRESWWAVLAAVALLTWCWYFYRLLRQAVMVRGDVLVVHNLLATRRVRRSQVRDVYLGESSVAKSPNQTVVMRLQDGSELSLDACARSTQSRRWQRRLDDYRAYLTAWSHVGRQPQEVAVAAESGGTQPAVPQPGDPGSAAPQPAAPQPGATVAPQPGAMSDS